MADRYTLKWNSTYGTNDESFNNLDEALAEFLSFHSEGVKVQLTADVPKIEDENDEWDF